MWSVVAAALALAGLVVALVAPWVSDATPVGCLVWNAVILVAAAFVAAIVAVESRRG